MGRATRGRHGVLARVGVCVAAMALVASACGDDDDDDEGETGTTAAGSTATTESTSPESTSPPDTGPGGTAAPTGAVLEPPATGPDLGAADAASGEPVKVGVFHDGTTAAVDHGDDTIVAEALADYWNEHQGGVGGRPIELVICETNADPAIATDCGNRFVEEGVVFVATHASGFGPQVYPPVHDAGIPFLGGGLAFPELVGDTELGFISVNTLALSVGMPIAVGREVGATKVVSMIIDVPSAHDIVPFLDFVAAEAGMEHEAIFTTPGTPDMAPQVQLVIDSGAEVVSLIYDPAGSLVALRNLYDAGYEGTIVAGEGGVSSAAFESLPIDRLQELRVGAVAAMGDETNSDWQLYEAIMDEYASRQPEVSGVRGWMYQTLFNAFWALQDVEGEITPQVVADALHGFPEARQPLGAGYTWRCDGSQFPGLPAICTAGVLQARFDENRDIVDYQALDVGPEIQAMSTMLGG